MTEQYKKAQYFLASYQALSNASEMIRSHGEEGFSYEDKAFNKEYMRQKKKIAEQLDKRAYQFFKKYEDMNLDIESEIDLNY